MTKLNKWVAKHQRLAWILFSAIEILVYAPLLYELGCPIGAIVLIALLLVSFNYLFVKSAILVLLKKPMEALTVHGDPEPLLHITEELVTFKLSEADHQVMQINYCVALRETGELQKAHDILTSINIDKCSGMPPVNKATYYNNLADIFNLLGDEAQAEIWQLKMLQIYHDMPENKFKSGLKHSMLLVSAENCIRHGDYSQAMLWLNQTEPTDLSKKTAIALLRAQLSLKTDDIEAAKRELNEIVRIGNKLYAVKIAEKMLSEL